MKMSDLGTGAYLNGFLTNEDDVREPFLRQPKHYRRSRQGSFLMLRAVDWGMLSAGRVAPQENPRRAPVV